MSFMRLRTSDGQMFMVKTGIAMLSPVLRDMYGCCGLRGTTMQPISLEKIDSHTLKAVLKWLEHHKENAIMTPEEAIAAKLFKNSNNIEMWDRRFMQNFNQPALLALVVAADFLHLTKLVNLISKTIANMIKGKKPDEIRQTFGIELESDQPQPGSSVNSQHNNNSSNNNNNNNNNKRRRRNRGKQRN